MGSAPSAVGLAFFACLSSVKPAAPGSQLIVVAGQSNAVGFGLSGADLPAQARFLGARVQILVGKRFEPMTAGINTGAPHAPRAWGPEVGFSRAWLKDHAIGTLYIVKEARGSTSLDPNTNPTWSPSRRRSLFDSATAAVLLAERITNLHPSGVLWMQGEADATNAGYAAAYPERLSDLIAEMRVAWRLGAAPVLIGRISRADALPFEASVRRAQDLAPLSDSLVRAVDTDRLPQQSDHLHFSAAGQLALGAGFYAALGRDGSK